MSDPVDDFARGPEMVFANPESCMLGPVRVTKVLSVLKPFARYAAREEIKGLFPDFDAALHLYLDLGGKL